MDVYAAGAQQRWQKRPSAAVAAAEGHAGVFGSAGGREASAPERWPRLERPQSSAPGPALSARGTRPAPGLPACAQINESVKSPMT